MALRFLGENNVHFYQEDLPMVIRSTIFKDINKELRSIINHIATEFLRHLLLGHNCDHVFLTHQHHNRMAQLLSMCQKICPILGHLLPIPTLKNTPTEAHRVPRILWVSHMSICVWSLLCLESLLQHQPFLTCLSTSYS